MDRLTARKNPLNKREFIVFTKGIYEDTTAAEMTIADIRLVLLKLARYEDLEESGRLYIMSEKVASHVKDVISKAEYQARIKAETNHGAWTQDLDDVICSECKTHWNIFDDCTETFKYCPNCGAKMEGVQNDNKSR